MWHVIYGCSAAALWQVLVSEDVRFNAPLYKACQTTIPRLCAEEVSQDGWEWESADAADQSAQSAVGMTTLHGKVLNCLIRQREQISEARSQGPGGKSSDFQANAKECQAQVLEAMSRIAEDLNLNPELHDACFEDQKYFCANIQPGSGSVNSCMKAHLEFLQPRCRRAEFEEISQETSDIDLQPEVRQSCAREISELCGSSPKKKIIRCLQDQMQSDRMGEPCRDVLLEDEALIFRYSSLNSDLKTKCADDVTATACGLFRQEYNVYPCLKESLENIETSECKAEIKRVIQKQVRGVRPVRPVL